MAKNPITINLQEFVTEALVQIVEGVKEAQNKTVESGAKINPIDSTFYGGALKYIEGGYGDEEYGQMIEFDVAVTAADKSDLKGGIGVIGGAVSLGYKAERGVETGSVSRIKFSVPVFLPQQKIKYKISDL